MPYEYTNRIADVDSIKNEIDAFRPFNEHIVNEIRKYFRVGLTYSSNALEGNSLTESETKVVIEDGITIGGKSLQEHNEALGHSEAYSLLDSPKTFLAKTCHCFLS